MKVTKVTTGRRSDCGRHWRRRQAYPKQTSRIFEFYAVTKSRGSGSAYPSG
jgi:hypothetical protein